MSAPLAIEGLVAGYEPGLDIVRGVDLTLAAGEITALLGPNGAGKSTLVKAVAGLVPVRAGRVRLDGCDLAPVPVHARSARGLAYVPQNENVFATMTVRENLAIAAVPLPRRQRGARVRAMLDLFPDLGRAQHRPAGLLSGGQRQMLAVARALLTSPAALLLDEPTAGLAPRIAADLAAMLRETARSGARTGPAILIVEQNVPLALDLADRAIVLVEGRVRREAPAARLDADGELAALFLGLRREPA